LIIYITIFNRDYVPMLEVALHSLLKISSNKKIYVGFSNLRQNDINLLIYGYPSVIFIKECDLTLKENKLHSFRASQKLQRWKDFYDKYTAPEDYILFCDADLIFHNDFEKLIDHNSDLMITQIEGQYLINTGVVGMKKNFKASNLFDQWVAENSKILSHPKLYQQANDKYGGADQHSLINILNLQRITHNGIDELVMNPHNLLKLQILSGNLINNTKSSQVNEQTSIYHVKSGFHRILLKRGHYTKLRTEEKSRELHHLWEGLYQEAKRQSMKNYLMTILSENRDRFDLSNEKYLPNGIFKSELYIIICLAVSLKIDTFIESGRGSGFSTELLAKFLNPLGIKIISIELNRNDFSEKVSRRLQKYENLELLFGDSTHMIPSIIKRYSKQKIGVLLVEPKGYRAVKNLKRLILKNENILVGIIHDMRKLENGKPSYSRFYAEHEFDRIIFSDDHDLVGKIRFMDDSFWSHKYVDSLDKWKPYTKGFQFVESYGPTIGVIFPTIRDFYGNKMNRIIDILNERVSRVISFYSWKRKIKKLFINIKW
jgi:hypothetical protein